MTFLDNAKNAHAELCMCLDKQPRRVFPEGRHFRCTYPLALLKIKQHATRTSCDIEDFVKTHIFASCVILR